MRWHRAPNRGNDMTWSAWTQWAAALAGLAAVLVAVPLEAQTVDTPPFELVVGAKAPICEGLTRLAGNPIISPRTDASIGTNISGPTLIRVPRWVSEPLGQYYLYFADHNGKYIRLAYADALDGPWRVHKPGALDLAESFFTDHIASPEAIVDDASQRIVLYFHGLTPEDGTQHTRVATSTDGVDFTTVEEPVGTDSAYWRVFDYGEWWYAMAMPGREGPVNVHRSRDPLTPFERGPRLFPVAPRQVHNAVRLRGDVLDVFYTREADRPERILHSEVTLGPDWTAWSATPPRECLAPETEWEGAGLPVVPGTVGALSEPSHALRDPAIFEEDGRTYLLYAVAGESGIAIAELKN